MKLLESFFFGNTKILILKGDITEQGTQAIVNAANSSLMGGGGVDGAIHHKGGTRIIQECTRIRTTQWPDGLPTGKSVITTGGDLPAKYVIHTVGPVWRGGSFGESELLSSAYRSSLELASSRGLRSVAFPPISTGAYGYPIDRAARVALQAVKGFLSKPGHGIEEVRFVLFAVSDYEFYRDLASEEFA